MGIFKAYDVRGLYPEELDEDLARRLGHAFGRSLAAKGTVAVGRDMRPSSVPLADALADGLLRAGCDVLDIGFVTTPCLYFAVGARKCKGGVMITASHNPARYNGLKLCGEGATPIGSESGLKEIEAAVAKKQALPEKARGKRTSVDLRADYVQHLLKLGGKITKLKVAFDCANGAVGSVLPLLLEKLPQIEAVRLFFEPDGTFPNHEPNPLVEENLAPVKRAVLEKKCDLGVAYDGDGDRVFFVDAKGETIASDLLCALLARRVLEREKGAVVIYDLRSSRVVEEEIKAAGGVPREERVGHAFIKKTMRETNAPFAGELSGHFYWRDHFYCDTALLTTLKVLGVAGEKKLEDLIRPLRRTHRSGEVNYEVADKDGALERLEKAFPGAAVSKLDGVTIRLADFWFNARKSNTEPLLRLNIEAKNAKLLDETRKKIESVLGAKPVEHA
ncbi:phosphomannomutase/phosphoglucomutase [bacterium]|nr:phosphomannomutase/phosphoglucomutase [bacterium]